MLNLNRLIDLCGPQPNPPENVPQELVEDVMEDLKKARTYELIKMIVINVLVILLVLLLGKWLWNKALVPHVTILRPLETVWPLLGIVVLLSILHGGARC